MPKPPVAISRIVFIDLYVNQKKSGLEIARFFGIGRTTVSRYIKRYGLEPRTISEVRENKYWGPSEKQIRALTDFTATHKGEKSPVYKNGHINTQGYRVIKRNGRYYKEHRWVMMQAIGRNLRKDEDVHHKNGNKLDNRLANLQLLTKSEHSKLHWSRLHRRAIQSRKIKERRRANNWSTKKRS